jgi:hypothetical protein
MHALFPPYRGPAIRLFRGAGSDEALKRKFYGISWASVADTAHWFAKRFEVGSLGGVVLETMAPADAIISAPGLDGPHYEHEDGRRMYDESEYLVDGRRLVNVKVIHRYRPLNGTPSR